LSILGIGIEPARASFSAAPHHIGRRAAFNQSSARFRHKAARPRAGEAGNYRARDSLYRPQILDAIAGETYLDCFKACDAAPSTPLKG
jgi:hypothetical protein